MLDIMAAERPVGRRGLIALAFLLIPSAYAHSESKDSWLEVRSPNFIVCSNAGEKKAREIAREFEAIRSAYHEALPKLRLDLGKPIVILAVKNEDSMKALLPGYWEQKGHVHPAGIYVRGEDKHYVALRTDAQGASPYHTVYHEYTHALMHVNFPPLPTWLDEGLAEFYANASIGAKEFRMGAADSAHLVLLQQSKLIPVDVLLEIDHRSPYYNEQDRASIFYAESWALVHFLMVDPYARKEQLLLHFLQAWQQRGNQREAARQTFGDLKRFSERIETHARQTAFYVIRLKSSVEDHEQTYQTRAISPGESLTLRGDFQLHTGRMSEARALLEEAMEREPNLAEAHEGLGHYYLWQHDLENAGNELQRATELNSKNFLTYYTSAMLNLQNGMGTPENLQQAEASLEKAVELNPKFAPAYANLASLYVMRREAQEKALAAALRATELEPGTMAYAVTLGYILMNMNRNEEARTLAARLSQAAQTPAEVSSAKAFQENVEARLRLPAQLAVSKETQAEDSESGSTTALKPPEEPRTPSNLLRGPDVPEPRMNARIYEMKGTITTLSCSPTSEVTVVLSAGLISMKLHSRDMSKITLNDHAPTAKSPAARCTAWRGRSAIMFYHLTPGGNFDGELTAIRFF
jgi:tetratricopeptide (TPR) repeat protein